MSIMEMAMPVMIALMALALAMSASAQDDHQLDEHRIDEVARMLPEAPEGLGRPITDRDAWEALGDTEAFQRMVERAESYLDEPLPEQPDDLYLDFSRTGNRTRWQRVAGRRRGRLAPLVLAECVEDEGRFLDAIAELVEALSAERTWVMPAHDRDLKNFHGERTDIDLASSAVGWNLATAAWLLGDRLDERTRELIAQNLDARVITPYRRMIRGERDRNWWMTTTNNWNAVCLAGVTGTGLAQLEDPRERAEFVVAAEHYSRSFLSGFTADGYCSEGLGYWNYGFGHYVLLADTIWQATGGELDLLTRPDALAPAMFPRRIQIIGGVAPAFADCGINARPSSTTMWYLNERFDMDVERYEELPVSSTLGNLFGAMIFNFPNAATEAEPIEAGDAEVGLRSFFDDAAVLIGRPAEDSDCALGVALKGGHNSEHHNHNDVGSYVVVVEDEAPLLDPGSEVYTARTFSSRRYESNLLNSYGHPVPRVAGQLQRTGREAAAEVLQADFSDERDVLALDLSAAYDVPELQTLTRTFEYSRVGEGALTVRDRVEFTQPAEFETAFITDGGWLERDDGTLVAWEVDRAVQIEVTVDGASFDIEADEIHEEARAQPTRIAVHLSQPFEAATVTAVIMPLAELGADRSGLLRNGDFELDSFAWSLGDFSEVSSQTAASGEKSLHIVDDSDEHGSNVRSARIEVDGARPFVLSGMGHVVSGQGVGLYVRYYDADGSRLNEADERGNIASVGNLSGEPGQWRPFEFAFETPEGTASIDLWIHSYNAAVVEAFIDVLRITPAGE